MKNILIVESPTKSKTIEGYLGEDFKVLSSKGHICDLSTKGRFGLGVDIENDFKPDYIQTKEQAQILKNLLKECKDAKIYLATDPDREGEAISYHLANYLNLDLDSDIRVVFHEITKPAILEAMQNIGKIDLEMVNSQETRRILDRIIGFKVSSLLRSKIKSQSAGRVQSVALKIICDLEKEIKDFIPIYYFEAEALFSNFKLDLVKVNGSKERILDRKILEDLFKNLDAFKLEEVSSKESSSNSKPPFTTSTLQQEAANKYNFSGAKTMQIAQKLYEGINIGDETKGLITYIRTDSTHMSSLFVDTCNKYIENKYGQNYLGEVKEKKQALSQNAHEAIRQTDINLEPDTIKTYLSNDEYKLYKLIYNRTIQSLMKPAIFLNTTVTFSNYNSLWETKGKQLLFDGYLKVAGISEDEKNKLLPEFNNDTLYYADEINILDKETKPKSRYTEASLIKEMEEKGIGRPSTYASTLQTLLKREYVTYQDKKIIPTDQGILTSDLLTKNFPDIFNLDYTANMENVLDDIALGKANKVEELHKFYDKFNLEYEQAKKNIEKIVPTPTGELCPLCNSPLVIRKGKYGEFVGCSNYPSCKYIKKEEDNEEILDVKCPNCGGNLVKKEAKRGRNKGNLFYSCVNYPNCKTIYNDLPTNELCPKCNSIMLKDKDGNLYCSNKCDEEVIKCPNCGGNLVKKVALRGKNKGNIFYACSNFPKCKTIFNDKPLNRKCDKCNSIMLEKDDKVYCSNEACKNHEK